MWSKIRALVSGGSGAPGTSSQRNANVCVQKAGQLKIIPLGRWKIQFEKMKQKKLYPFARWTKWRPHPSRGCFVAGCSLNNHPGREKKVVHIMQTVDTCMQYWREKIIKIRGQSLSSRFFSLIILITDCPPPFQCHRILANLDPAALFWRNSLWLWIVVEWVCTCVLAEAEDSLMMLCSSSIQVWKSEHYASMQACPSTEMHQERKHVHKWTLKYAEEQSHWLARPSFCCLVTERPSSS